MVLESYLLMSYDSRVSCPMVLESYMYVLWSCVLWSYCLMPYDSPTVLCPIVLLSYVLYRQWDIKPGLHSMQKAQFNTKRKIGFISFLSIKINVTLCMLSVKDPRGYGRQHTSLATVVFILVPEVVP